MTSILIYSQQCSPRLDYVLHVLFGQVLGWSYRHTTDLAAYCAATGPRLCYGAAPDQPFPGLRLPDAGLLYERDVRILPLLPAVQDGLPVLFACPDQTAGWSFDFFSMAFFLLSRYEEYWPFAPDAHGRFPASESVASKHGFLRLPIINLWAERLRLRLAEQYPGAVPPRPAYSFLPTYDIDVAWAYRHLPLWRQLSGLLRDIAKRDAAGLRARLSVWSGQAADPFYTFGHLDDLAAKYQLQPLYFFLLADHSRLDSNNPPTSTAMRCLVKRVASRHRVGIHPSYQSNQNTTKLRQEIDRLAKLTGAPVTRSRQHFLKLSLPHTFRHLLAEGIADDYTLGYADDIGFRAGIAAPFNWYDLLREAPTSLTLHPFAAMDVTLLKYLGHDAEEAFGHVQNMMDTLKSTGGTFVLLWHNSSFSAAHGWAGWAALHERLLAEGVPPASERAG